MNKKICITCVLLFAMVVCFARCIKSNLIATPNGEVDLLINKSDAASLFDYLSNQEDIEGNLFETLYENDDIAIYSDDMCYLSFEEEKRR